MHGVCTNETKISPTIFNTSGRRNHNPGGIIPTILMLKRFVLAQEAEELGMVSRVVPTELLEQELVNMAKVIAKDPISAAGGPGT